MELLEGLLNIFIGWIDKLISWFDSYSSKYSHIIVWGLVLAVVGKYFAKVKVDVKAGK